MAIHRLLASRPYLPVVLIGHRGEAAAVALIDTGASMTAVRRGVIERVGGIMAGSESIGGVDSPSHWAPTFYLSMRFGAEPRAHGIEVVAGEPASSCDVLIGRDLLGLWVLSWDGPGDRLIVSY